MATPVVQPATDTTPPTVAITTPVANVVVSDVVTVAATASDNIGVLGIQFLVDGLTTGNEIASPPYQIAWDTHTFSNGAHTLRARARDLAGNVTLSTPVSVTVDEHQRLPERGARNRPAPADKDGIPPGRPDARRRLDGNSVRPAASLHTTRHGAVPAAHERRHKRRAAGLQNLVLDPDFATNHYYYVFYTLGSPNRDRLSRFTANASLTGTIAGSELVLYQDPLLAGVDHHGGAIVFGNDGKLYFTTGDEVDTPAAAQSLSSPRGKIHRINKDGTVPTDNPFYDGTGPNVDSVWALGFRNPFRGFYDAPTGRFFIGDVGGNDYSTAYEELDVGVAGANYGWPNCESICPAPYRNGIYAYPHSGRDAAIVSGFVYRGSQFPSGYVGDFFFADYAQNWIRRLTLDANGNVTGVFNFEPPDGTLDGPYGDIVDLQKDPTALSTTSTSVSTTPPGRSGSARSAGFATSSRIRRPLRRPRPTRSPETHR